MNTKRDDTFSTYVSTRTAYWLAVRQVLYFCSLMVLSIAFGVTAFVLAALPALIAMYVTHNEAVSTQIELVTGSLIAYLLLSFIHTYLSTSSLLYVCAQLMTIYWFACAAIVQGSKLAQGYYLTSMALLILTSSWFAERYQGYGIIEVSYFWSMSILAGSGYFVFFSRVLWPVNTSAIYPVIDLDIEQSHPKRSNAFFNTAKMKSFLLVCALYLLLLIESFFHSAFANYAVVALVVVSIVPVTRSRDKQIYQWLRGAFVGTCIGFVGSYSLALVDSSAALLLVMAAVSVVTACYSLINIAMRQEAMVMWLAATLVVSISPQIGQPLWVSFNHLLSSALSFSIVMLYILLLNRAQTRGYFR